VHDLFWLVPGRLAGRAGPDRLPWKLEALRDAGVGAVLTVNDGRECDPAEFRALGLSYGCIPLPPHAPPWTGDDRKCLSALPLAHAFIEKQTAENRATMVHCSSGKDRTGLLLAYYLIRSRSLSVDAAMREVRRVRPIAFTATGWNDFAADVLRRAARAATPADGSRG
jgi:protein-tyrosine phosphatase